MRAKRKPGHLPVPPVIRRFLSLNTLMVMLQFLIILFLEDIEDTVIQDTWLEVAVCDDLSKKILSFHLLGCVVLYNMVVTVWPLINWICYSCMQKMMLITKGPGENNNVRGQYTFV